MKDYSPTDIRNICLIGHGSSGKTTLTEAMLFAMKAVDRMGSIDDGTTHSDFMKEEIERNSSISTSLLSGEFKKIKFNILDTPGFSDFIGEVKGALSVTDLAVTVIHGVSGIEVVTEQVWNFAQEENVPRCFFVNMNDKENANFDKVSGTITNQYPGAVVIHYPVNPGPAFNRMLDILNMKLITFEDNGKHKVEEIPADLQEKADELREQLVERAAETDDELMEKYFDAGELSQDELREGLKAGILANEVFPIAAGAAAPQMGADFLLNFLMNFAPSPVERGAVTARHPDTGEEIELETDPEGPTVALVFKTTTEAHVGEMSFIKLFSGTLRTGDEVTNVQRESTEKINQMFTSIGKQRDPIDHLTSGDMCVLVKLKNTGTGDTLCDPKNPVVLPPPHFPEPSIRAAVTSKSTGDEDKLSEGLNILQKADPTFNVSFDPDMGQTILSGQGDAQFSVILSRLKDRFGVDAVLVEPRIPYRETIKSKGEAEGKHKKQSGGRGQFGIAWIRVEPMPQGAGYEFVDEIVGGVIPRQFIPAVDKGFRKPCPGVLLPVILLSMSR